MSQPAGDSHESRNKTPRPGSNGVWYIYKGPLPSEAQTIAIGPWDGENPEPRITQQPINVESFVREARWLPSEREATPPSWPAFFLRVLIFVLSPWRWLSTHRHAQRLDKWCARLQEQWDFDIQRKPGGSRPLPESEEEFLQRVYLLVKAEFAGMTTRVPTWKMYSELKARRWSGRTLEDMAAKRLVAYMYWSLVWNCFRLDFLDAAWEYIGM